MDNEQDDENIPKWHYVLPKQTYGNGRWKAGDVVELLPAQAQGWIESSISKGYASEANARKAAEPKAEKASAPKESAKEVTDVK